MTEVTGPWQRGLLAAITPLWDVVVCLWPQHVLRPQQGAWAQLTWVLIPQRRVDSGLLLWACPSLGVHHWGSQGPGEGSWEGQYQSHLSAPRACGVFSTLQIKLESALGSVTYHSKGGTAMLSVFPGSGDTLKCGFFGAKVSA